MSARLKIAVIGDPHIAVPQGDPDPRLEPDPGRKLHGLSTELLAETIKQVNAERGLEAAVILGDMTRDSERFNHIEARKLLEKLELPFYIVTGNHDMLRHRPDGMSYPPEQRCDKEEYCEIYADFGLPGGMTHYVVELPGNVALVVLDSNRTLKQLAETNEEVSRQDDGWIGEWQLAWLDSVLSRIADSGHLPLVCVHHSITDHSPAEQPKHTLYRVFRYWQAHDSEAFRSLASKYRVPLVLSGHLHAQSVNTMDSVTNLITAAPVSYPHAWRILHIEHDEIYVESRRLAAIPSRSELQKHSYRWMAEGMGHLIEEKTAGMPLLKEFTREVGSFVTECGWWSRFCDGTLATFEADASGLPLKNAMAGMVYGQVSKLMNEFAQWKAERPDPNELAIPLKAEYRGGR